MEADMKILLTGGAGFIGSHTAVSGKLFSRNQGGFVKVICLYETVTLLLFIRYWRKELFAELWIASNMDQYLTMSYIEKAGTGKLIRSELAHNKIILEKSINALLYSSEYKANAKIMKTIFNKLDSCKEFNSFIASILENSND